MQQQQQFQVHGQRGPMQGKTGQVQGQMGQNGQMQIGSAIQPNLAISSMGIGGGFSNSNSGSLQQQQKKDDKDPFGEFVKW